MGNCLALTTSNKRCQHKANPSGYCHLHEEEFMDGEAVYMVKCKDCLINTKCDKREESVAGVCYYEMRDAKVSKLDDKEKVAIQMRRLLRNESLMIGRLQRQIAAEGDVEGKTKLIDLMQRQENNVFKHFEQYAKFMGWADHKLSIEEKRQKYSLIGKILAKSERQAELYNDDLQQVFDEFEVEGRGKKPKVEMVEANG